jgi:hypothetical protein
MDRNDLVSFSLDDSNNNKNKNKNKNKKKKKKKKIPLTRMTLDAITS